MIKIIFVNESKKILLESFAPVLPDRNENVEIERKTYIVEARSFKASEDGMLAYIMLCRIDV